MGRRNDHSRIEFRELALDAATSIVAAHGLSALSARKVAAKISYTVGSLYLAFRNLDDLVQQVNQRTFMLLLESVQDAVARSREPAQQVFALGDAYIDFASLENRLWSAIFEHRMASGCGDEGEFNAQADQISALMHEALQLMAPARTPEQVGIAARSLFSGVHGVCAMYLINGSASDGATARRLAHELITNYLDGFTQDAQS